MSKVLVIGGGAAGMMAAYAAAESGHQVTLIEKNEKLGKKVYITGKGRCNVTNACATEDFFNQVVTNKKFLYSALYQFDTDRLMNLLEENGCKLKVERGGRVFPVSDHASDIIGAMKRILNRQKVEIMLLTEVEKLLVKDQEMKGVVLKNGETITADAVIVSTGGLSYETTGSTGDGFKFAKDNKIAVTETVPSLVPLETAEKWCQKLQGLSLKNVALKLLVDGKEKYNGFGEMLFTHFGVSGPLALTASCYYYSAVKQAMKKKKDGTPAEVKLSLDLKPALTAEQLDKRILRDFESEQNKAFKNALNGLYPSKMVPVMIELSGIDPEQKVNLVTREQRQKLVSLTKDLRITVTGTRDFKEAIITQGGVSVKEINPSTMESKKVKGLFFAGEVLDVDAFTGGFNLQIAWSTGYLAGNSIS
ncbi:MAG: NAD(P)/FAD-dependent oxidoreductase [Lachnospiraceae bacterium]|nr:NAD(P)/FAD-dependent oxidoreductase [Lachnospiraceae bacterium]